MTSIIRPKTATLAELHESFFYKKLRSFMEDVLPLLGAESDVSSLISSRFGQDILEIYGILHKGSFNRQDMTALEYSGFLSQILPFLSLERLPLVSSLERGASEAGKVYKNVRMATVMTCIWAFVEESGGTTDILSKIAKGKLDAWM